MTPHHIVLRAAQYGIGGVVISDHNASANIPALLEAAAQYGIEVLPGMEVESVEEAHIVVLFDTWEQMERWQELIDSQRPPLLNKPDKFGAQYVVDAEDEFVREEEKLLLGPGSMSAAEIVDRCHEYGGIAIAAHIDKPSYSLLTQLGFFDEELHLDGAEISRNSLQELKDRRLAPLTGNLPYVTDSDAHCIIDFVEGPKNLLRVERFTTAEIVKALRGLEGRGITPGCFAKK